MDIYLPTEGTTILERPIPGIEGSWFVPDANIGPCSGTNNAQYKKSWHNWENFFYEGRYVSE